LRYLLRGGEVLIRLPTSLEPRSDAPPSAEYSLLGE
jgi:hypothetical protein